MSRKWNSNAIITKEQLMEEFNILEVKQYGWVTKDGVYREPTVSPQYRKDKRTVGYVVCQCSLYSKKTKRYLRLPFSKLVYAWYNGETSQNKVIDHINQNPLDCRPENLREVPEFWNLSKNQRVWNWPQTDLWSAKVRKQRGVTYEQLIEALGEWIEESIKFYEKVQSGNNLFSQDELN